MKTLKLEILKVFLVLVALATPLFAQGPVVSVTLKNLETSGEKLTAMAEDLGDQEFGMAVSTFQSFITQPSFTEGIDVKRPVGLFLFPNDKQEPPAPVLVIPVKDVEKAQKLIPNAAFAVEKTGENTWEVFKKDGENKHLVARVVCQGEWCFVQSDKTDISIADCGQKLVQLLSNPFESDFQVKLYVNAIPLEMRKEIVKNFVEVAKNDLENEGGKKIGKKMASLFLAELENFAGEAASHNWESPVTQISVGYTWDENGKKLVIRNAFTGNQGAHQIQDLSAATVANTSALNGFGAEGTLGSYHLNAKIDGLNEAIFEDILSIHRENIVKKVERKLGEEAAKEVSAWLTKNQPLFRAAFMGSEQEAAGAVYAEPGKKFTFIFARSVPDGYALEKTIGEAVKYVCEKKGEKCKNRVKNGKRTEDGDLHIYQAEIKLKKCPCEAKKHCPKSVPVCLIFAPKAIYGAVGTDAVETLVKNIQACKTAEAPAFTATVSLQKALKVCCKAKGASDEQKSKLEKLGDANVTIQVLSREDGAEIVTEIPVQVFKAAKILGK